MYKAITTNCCSPQNTRLDMDIFMFSIHQEELHFWRCNKILYMHC